MYTHTYIHISPESGAQSRGQYVDDKLEGFAAPFP